MKRPERPSAVLVVAILQICFGSLGLLGSLCGGGMQLAGGAKMFAPPPGAQAPPDVEGMMRAKVPYYMAVQYGGLALGLVSGTVMVVGAIGLLKVRPWGRHLTIGYACYNIVSSILGFIFTMTVTRPIMKEVWAELRADPKLPPQAANVLSMTETFTSFFIYASLVFLVYPISLLIVMFLPHVREAFHPTAPGPVDEEFEDEGFDDEGDGAIRPGEAPAPPREEPIQPGEESGER
jgi:hypothetical protein